MSMLTPPGMGGKYRVTGTQYPRMRPPRRRGRILAAAVGAAAVAGLLGWGSTQLIEVFSGGGARADAAQKPTPCRRATASPVASTVPAASATPAVTAFRLPKASAVTVNVYNATTRSGLGKKTADELAARGFAIATFGNAPGAYDQKVSQAALLVTGPDGAAAARTVAAQLAGTPVFRTDPKMKGATVDLMLGKGYTKLNGAAAVRKAMAALAHPSPSPTPSPTPTHKATRKRSIC